MRLLVVLLMMVTTNAFATKVLLIESYHAEYPWDASYVKGLEKTLLPSVILETFQMDTKRLPKNEYERKANEAFEVYQQLKPEIVILGDDNALAYMLPKLYDEDISIVFLGINSNPRHLFGQYKGQAKITGVLERPLFVKSLGELRSMFTDDPFKVRVMFDSGVTSQIAKEYIDNQYRLIKENLGIDAEILTIGTKQEWRERVLNAKDEGVSVIIIGLYHTLVDEAGKNVLATQVINWTSENSPLPIFAFWDFAVGEGKAAGGIVLYGYSQGEMAATLVNRIVNGESASSMPIQIENKGSAIYSQVAMEQWGLTAPSHWKSID
jgi:ABC-type uncharacterized transport system substrate-binding protein